MILNNQEVQSRIDELVAKYKESIQDNRLSLNEAWKICQLAITQIVTILQELAEFLPGTEKKSAAMEAFSLFYDTVLLSISIPFIPNWIARLMKPYIRSIFMLLVNGSIDAIVTTLRDLGIFKKKVQE